MERKYVADDNKNTKVPSVGKKMSDDKNRTIIKKNSYRKWQFWAICGGAIVLAIAAISVLNKKTYEEYDVKGLTVKEACEKVRGAGWEVSSIRKADSSDKTDCYNEKETISDYYYSKGYREVSLYYGEKKTEEQKKSECEASGKWYRDNQCKAQEEWENDYKWKEAHSACKKYGANAYAKTLTDCYVGSDYKGKVDEEPKEETTTQPQSQPQSNTNSSSSEWKQFLKDYEAWVDKYVAFMKKYKNASTSDMTSMMSEYSSLLSDLTSWSEKSKNMQSNLSGSDLTEYINTLSRITQKLSSI